jgi:hypothetical protein
MIYVYNIPVTRMLSGKVAIAVTLPGLWSRRCDILIGASLSSHRMCMQ